MHAPPPPVVAAALSGFVVGVFLTLLATGTLVHTSPQGTVVGTSPPATVVSDVELKQRIQRLVGRVLGPQPSEPKRSRLLDVQLYPVYPADSVQIHEIRQSAYRSVVVTVRLNDHPFGPSWRLRAAQADVFDVMQALYTSQLSVYDVEVDGKFSLDKSRPQNLAVVLRAYLGHDRAITIPWHHWGRGDEGKLWRTLDSKWVDGRFG